VTVCAALTHSATHTFRKGCRNPKSLGLATRWIISSLTASTPQAALAVTSPRPTPRFAPNLMVLLPVGGHERAFCSGSSGGLEWFERSGRTPERFSSRVHEPAQSMIVVVPTDGEDYVVLSLQVPAGEGHQMRYPSPQRRHSVFHDSSQLSNPLTLVLLTLLVWPFCFRLLLRGHSYSCSRQVTQVGRRLVSESRPSPARIPSHLRPR
jgi:hypothetical protein